MKTIDLETTECSSSEAERESAEVSDLGRRLRAIRERYLAEGGKLLTMSEIEAELAERRGGHFSED